MQSNHVFVHGEAPVLVDVPRRNLRLVQFGLHSRDSLQRAEVERYVAARFARAHGACIDHYLPLLVTQSQAGRTCAAVGLAPASCGPMFAEKYLARPVEELVTDADGRALRRADTLEIGNLVSSWRGSSLLLFVFLSELVERLGFRWVLFTATAQVERLLDRLEYAPRVLANADPARLADAGASWGRYYERGPRVMLGEVRPAVSHARKGRLYRTVARALGAEIDAVCGQFRQHLREQRIAVMAAPTGAGQLAEDVHV